MTHKAPLYALILALIISLQCSENYSNEIDPFYNKTINCLIRHEFDLFTKGQNSITIVEAQTDNYSFCPVLDSLFKKEKLKRIEWYTDSTFLFYYERRNRIIIKYIIKKYNWDIEDQGSY